MKLSLPKFLNWRAAWDGQTYTEAIRNAEIIIGEWIETVKTLGRNIPEPKGRLKYA